MDLGSGGTLTNFDMLGCFFTRFRRVRVLVGLRDNQRCKLNKKCTVNKLSDIGDDTEYARWNYAGGKTKSSSNSSAL